MGESGSLSGGVPWLGGQDPSCPSPNASHRFYTYIFFSAFALCRKGSFKI